MFGGCCRYWLFVSLSAASLRATIADHYDQEEDQKHKERRFIAEFAELVDNFTSRYSRDTKSEERMLARTIAETFAEYLGTLWFAKTNSALAALFKPASLTLVKR